jgi:hypothetical protein
MWHRQTARVLPVDDEGRVLLLHGWDPGNSHGRLAGSLDRDEFA